MPRAKYEILIGLIFEEQQIFAIPIDDKSIFVIVSFSSLLV